MILLMPLSAAASRSGWSKSPPRVRLVGVATTRRAIANHQRRRGNRHPSRHERDVTASADRQQRDRELPLAHPPVAPDRERDEDRDDSRDPGQRLPERARYAAVERE